MSIDLILKKIFKRNPEFETKTDNENRFNNYIKLIENNVMGYDKTKVAGYLIAVIVEYLNNSEAIKSVEFENMSQNNSLIEQIYCELFLKKELYKLDDLRSECSISIDVNSIPIILNPWNGGRVVDNLMTIGEKENIFDGEKNKSNIQNHYLYPMDVVVCSGGNHSQFSARFKNNGKTIIQKKYDFSQLYNEVSFNGRNYTHKKDNSIIALEYDEELIFYSGIIFELGRYLLAGNYKRFD